MKINDKIKNRRLELGMTMLDVANKSGVSEATVSRWESGDIANMRRDKIVSLANALQVTPSFIMDDSPTELNMPNATDDVVIFPVIGSIAAGYDSFALDDWSGDTVEIPTSYLNGRNKEDFFVLSVKGDSMFPEYRENDKVLILKQSTLDYSGQVGAVIYDDENATLKKIEYKYGENWMRLVPINPNHQIVKIEDEKLEHCRVLGIPKYLVREIEQ